ncbi:hypothetical protein HPG69_007590 [Diceros bicornis minor]|uniref:Vomeronasal type-1 receptor n=1 Tax=Diceros bicornis minor TaxID=77932 RepID=A0A7J7EFM0_DICBM|nr:hypothetical protein HPG69_007590 [Diceros bicornis minor]
MMVGFGLKDFLNDFGCKLVFYAIMISPLNPRWAELKVKAPKYIGTSTILCWILNMMLDIILPLHITDKRNKANFTQKVDYGYFFNNPSFWLKNTSTRIAACFPTVSPYLLLSHDSRVSRVCFA